MTFQRMACCPAQHPIRCTEEPRFEDAHDTARWYILADDTDKLLVLLIAHTTGRVWFVNITHAG